MHPIQLTPRRTFDPIWYLNFLPPWRNAIEGVFCLSGCRWFLMFSNSIWAVAISVAPNPLPKDAAPTSISFPNRGCVIFIWSIIIYKRFRPMKRWAQLIARKLQLSAFFSVPFQPFGSWMVWVSKMTATFTPTFKSNWCSIARVGASLAVGCPYRCGPRF